MNIIDLKQQLKTLGAELRQEQINSPYNKEIKTPVYLRVFQSNINGHYNKPARALLIELEPSEVNYSDKESPLNLTTLVESYFQFINTHDFCPCRGPRWHFLKDEIMLIDNPTEIVNTFIVLKGYPKWNSTIPSLALVERNGTVTYYKQVNKSK